MCRFKELYAVIVHFPRQARVFTTITDSGRIYTIHILDLDIGSGSIVIPNTIGRVLHLNVNHNVRVCFRLNSNVVPCFIYMSPSVISVIQDSKVNEVWRSTRRDAFDTDNDIETEDSAFCLVEYCNNIGLVQSDTNSVDSGNDDEWSGSENP